MGATLNQEVLNGNPIINIILEKNNFFPGEIIEGYIFLVSGNLLKKGIINYSIINQEYYSFKDNNNNQKNSYLEEKQTNKLFMASLTYTQLIDFSLSKGKKIPFSILLPKNMLPNFEYSLPKVNGYIRNFLVIEIPEFNLIKKSFIIIKKKFNFLKSLLSFNINQNLNIFGFINRESISFKASYKKNCYTFFEKIPIEIEIDNNNNNIDIIKIIIKLLRKIIFKNKKKEKNNKKDFEYIDILFNNVINIDKRLNKNNKNIKINADIDFEEPESLFNKYKIGPDDFFFKYIKDKSNFIKLIPDLDSNLIQCEYKIKIEFNYKSWLKTEEIYIYMPLSINHEYILEKKINKKNILNNNENLCDFKKEEKEELKGVNENNKKNKIENNNEEKEGNKELNIYTNFGNDFWNTNTNEGIMPSND